MAMALVTLLTLSLGWILSDHFPPWTSFHAEAPAFAAGVLALVSCFYFSKSQRGALKLPVAVLLPLALGLIALFQWLAGQVMYGGDALVAVIYLMTFAIAWVWGYQWATVDTSGRLIEVVSAVLLVAGLITTWQVMAQWLYVEVYFNGWVLDAMKESRPTGNLGQPNQTATLLLMSVVAAVILAQKGRYGFKTLVALLVMLGWAVVLTQSRTALLSAAVLTAGYWAFNWSDPTKRRERIGALVWFGGLLLAGWLLQQANAIHVASKQGIGAENMVTTGARPLMWMQLLAALMERPWFGYGWQQVSMAHQAGAMQIAGTTQTSYAHNAVLDLALVIGLPLAVLVLGLVAWWLLRRYPVLRKHPDASRALFLTLPFFVHAQLELPHAYAYFLVPVGLLLGAIDAWTRPATALTKAVSGKAALVFAAAWCALLGAVAYEYMLVEEDFRVNRFENRRLGETPEDYRPPELLLLTQFGDMLQAMRLRAEPGMTAEQLTTLERASTRYIWAPLLYRTALAHALNHQPEVAQRHLLTIKRMFHAEIYEEGRVSWLRMQKDRYPELAAVRLP